MVGPGWIPFYTMDRVRVLQQEQRVGLDGKVREVHVS